MSGFRSELPSFAGLTAFEAASRTLSFTRAASELQVSQPAISRQIRALENHLGFALFRRLHREIELTPAGLVLAESLRCSLSGILATIERLKATKVDDVLVISSLISFSNLWLAPRLSEFRREHPDIRVRVVTHDHNSGPVAEDIDVAFRYKRVHRRHDREIFLFHDHLFPVYSPSYVERCGRVPHLADISQHLLIDDAGAGINWPGWGDWLAYRKYVGPRPEVHTHFSYYTDALTAALDGQGILLGWKRLIEPHLASGRLIVMDGLHMRTKAAHVAVLTGVNRPKLCVDVFIGWLLRHIA